MWSSNNESNLFFKLAIGTVISLLLLYTLTKDFTKITRFVSVDRTVSLDDNKSPLDLAGITLKPNLSQMINASQIITTIYTPYILENKEICTEVKNLSVLVIIHSAVNNFERRLSVRATWTNNRFYLNLGTVRTLFLLGHAKDRKEQREIKTEFNRYKDILQGDFSDDYHNLTLKGVMAYKWITERCRNAKIILKTDDDIVVNMFRFFSNIFKTYANKSLQIVCDYRPQGTADIFRDKFGEWYVSNNHFRGLSMYPTIYCHGFMVVITNDLIPALYSSSKVTPFFWVDDVYLYGLVPGNVPGVQYNRPKETDLFTYELDPLKCYRSQTEDCNYLVSGAKTREEFEEIWFHMIKQQAFVTA